MYLRDLYPTLDKEEREAFALRVGIKSGYLWQLATQWRDKKPSLDLLKKIAEADVRLTVAELVDEFTEDSEPVNGASASNDHPSGAAKPLLRERDIRRELKSKDRDRQAADKRRRSPGKPSNPKGR